MLIEAATNDDLINQYLDELMHLDPNLSFDDLLITTCPAQGQTGATGFADPQVVEDSCD